MQQSWFVQTLIPNYILPNLKYSLSLLQRIHDPSPGFRPINNTCLLQCGISDTRLCHRKYVQQQNIQFDLVGRHLEAPTHDEDQSFSTKFFDHRYTEWRR
jgi:hypothetical protein